MYYNVYKIYFNGTPHDHVALFVETAGFDKGGILYHVRGAIEVHGMHFTRTECRCPRQLRTFLEQERVGIIEESKLEELESCCESVPPPARQYDQNGPIEPRKPRRRCSQWFDELWSELVDRGIVEAC